MLLPFLDLLGAEKPRRVGLVLLPVRPARLLLLRLPQLAKTELRLGALRGLVEHLPPGEPWRPPQLRLLERGRAPHAFAVPLQLLVGAVAAAPSTVALPCFQESGVALALVARLLLVAGVELPARFGVLVRPGVLGGRGVAELPLVPRVLPVAQYQPFAHLLLLAPPPLLGVQGLGQRPLGRRAGVALVGRVWLLLAPLPLHLPMEAVPVLRVVRPAGILRPLASVLHVLHR